MFLCVSGGGCMGVKLPHPSLLDHIWLLLYSFVLVIDDFGEQEMTEVFRCAIKWDSRQSKRERKREWDKEEQGQMHH